jgi:hypothetical protein
MEQGSKSDGAREQDRWSEGASQMERGSESDGARERV